MKLLFDENLSFRLARLLSASYPGSQHVDAVGLHGRPDTDVWLYAQQHDLVIVSKDTDFREMSFLNGAPPKVVWLYVGNAGTDAIRQLLDRNRAQVEAFAQSADETLLVLGLDEPDRG